MVADQAALEARKKSKAAKSTAANATASADNGNNNKRSKKLIDVGARGVTDSAALEDRVNLREAKAANSTADARRSLGDVVDGAVGDVTGVVGDVTGTVGLKTRDGEEIRAVTDSAALEDRVNLRQAKASNGTAEARSVEGLAKKAANDTADAAAEARKTRKARKSKKARRSHQLW